MENGLELNHAICHRLSAKNPFQNRDSSFVIVYVEVECANVPRYRRLFADTARAGPLPVVYRDGGMLCGV